MPFLTTVRFGDIDTQGEHAYCAIDRVTPDGGVHHFFSLRAMVDSPDRVDNDAKCAANVLRFSSDPAYAGVKPTVGVYTVAHRAAPPGGYTLVLMGSSVNSILLLSDMTGEDIDDDTSGETGSERIECNLRDNGTDWDVIAHADDDADVWCGFRKVTWPAGYPMRKLPTLYKAGLGLKSGSYHYETQMIRDGAGFCYLTRVIMRNADTGDELPGCEIKHKDDFWVLKAHDKIKDDDNGQCEARCVEFTEPDRWPRSPDVVKWVGTPGPDLTPGAWGNPTGTGQPQGAYLKLFQSGAYDLPVLVIEGIDGLNVIGPTHYERHFGNLIGLMQQRYGADVWFFSPNGTLPVASGDNTVANSAREVAMAVQAVYTHTLDPRGYHRYDRTNGKKFVVVGLSQGALSGRIALANWETGLYREGTGGQPVVGITGNTPPVSLFVSMGGPHTGGAVPKAAQGALLDIDQTITADLSQSPVISLVKSKPAVNMLEDYTLCRSNFVTDQCSAISFGTFHDHTHDLWGTEPYETFGTEAYARVMLKAPWVVPWAPTELCPLGDHRIVDGVTHRCSGGCESNTTKHDDFFGYANTRGTAGNGFPQTVPSIAFVNAGFLRQGCVNKAPGSFCKTNYPLPFDTNTTWATFRFVDAGHSVADLCDRNATINFKTNLADLRPGDQSEITFEDLLTDATSFPQQVERVEISQNHPFLRTPTVSALDCPGKTSLSDCRTDNRTANRFDNVFTRQDDLNGLHGGIDLRQSKELLAYLVEYGVQDADGYFSSGNIDDHGLPRGDEAKGGDCGELRADINPGAGNCTDCAATVANKGSPCDTTADLDSCFDGQFVCSGGGSVCNDAAPDRVESCNMIDDLCTGVDDRVRYGLVEPCDPDAAGAIGCRRQGPTDPNPIELFPGQPGWRWVGCEGSGCSFGHRMCDLNSDSGTFGQAICEGAATGSPTDPSPPDFCDNGNDDNCDGLIDGSCRYTEKVCLAKQASYGLTCASCNLTACNTFCKTIRVCKGNIMPTRCDYGTDVYYDGGHLAAGDQCSGSNPSSCSCVCELANTVYYWEEPVFDWWRPDGCTYCGNGVIDAGYENCWDCPQDFKVGATTAAEACVGNGECEFPDLVTSPPDAYREDCSTSPEDCLDFMPESACDGIDQNCNGVTDEAIPGASNPCGGSCTLDHAIGSQCDGSDEDQCLEGTWQCFGLNTLRCTDETADDSTGNLFANPEFEDGLTSWVNGGASFQIDATVRHNGLKALHRIKTSTGDWGSVWQTYPFLIGKSYRMKAWIKTANITLDVWGSGATLYFEYSKADGTYGGGWYLAGTAAGTNDWKEYSGTFTVPADFASGVVGFYIPASGTGEAWWDDIAVFQNPDTCGDGLDNDCNTVFDDGCDQDRDNSPIPEDCNDTRADIHLGAPDLCDGADNDCDGQTDETYNVGGACSVGVGACTRYGALMCTGGGGTCCGSGGACLTPGPSSPESSASCGDGIDNDCDGLTDCADSCNNQICRASIAACDPAERCTAGACPANVHSCPVGGGCFVAGTPISMADGSTRNIEDVDVGDQVLAFDEATGAVVVSEVEQTFVHPNAYGTVLINGTVRVTPEHRFYSNGEWVGAGALAVGDQLYDLSASAPLRMAIVPLTVTSLESLPSVDEVYNFEVATYHNYFADGVLVHNAKVKN